MEPRGPELSDSPGGLPAEASAGRSGESVRSDLLVRFERRPSGGQQVRLLRSRVESSYGDAIVEQARELLETLGVEHGLLTIEDEGALPFTIAGRVEAAVRKARVPLPEGRHKPSAGPVPGSARRRSARDRRRRSRLYVPGNEPKHMVGAPLHGADGVILDLEDSVPPAAKLEARILVRHALSSLDFDGAERMVRINQLPLGLADLDELVPASPDLVLIPKVESADEVRRVERRIAHAKAEVGHAEPIWLMPIIESARGIENALEIAEASELVVALTIGLEDYTAELGVRKTPEGEESAWARARLVNAAVAAGVQPIDSVFGDVGELDALAAWARRARGLGFVGMGVIHPRQIPVVHEAFAPTSEEIGRALAIEEAWRAAEARGAGVVTLGSKMVDPPVVARARRLLGDARALGLVGAPREPR